MAALKQKANLDKVTDHVEENEMDSSNTKQVVQIKEGSWRDKSESFQKVLKNN